MFQLSTHGIRQNISIFNAIITSINKRHHSHIHNALLPLAATWSNHPVFLSFPQKQNQGWLWLYFFQIDPLIVVIQNCFLSHNFLLARSEIKWHISMFRNDTEIGPDNSAY